MSDTTTSNSSVVHDFRGMPWAEIVRKSSETIVCRGDMLLYDDAGFLVVEAHFTALEKERGFYTSCKGCAFLPDSIADILVTMSPSKVKEYNGSLLKCGLINFEGDQYHTMSPCMNAPNCGTGHPLAVFYKCVKSGVPWFVPSVETQNNSSQESQQPR